MHILILVFFTLVTSLCQASAQIKQFFPAHPVLLGDSLTWSIRLSYPVWEAYQVTVPPLDGTETRIDGPELSEREGQITAHYRILLTPQSLSVKDVPTAFITDHKGQSTVLAGKPVTVQSVSGDSLQIKNPPPLLYRPAGNNRVILYALLGTLLILLALMTVKRIRARNPRQVLLRNLNRARSDIQRGKIPPPVWRLLRSELLWGFPADTCTPSQLKTMAQSHPQLSVIAASLLSLEAWRYSGTQATWDRDLVLKSLESAMELAARKVPISIPAPGIAS